MIDKYGDGAETVIRKTVPEQFIARIWSKKLYVSDHFLYLVFNDVCRAHKIVLKLYIVQTKLCRVQTNLRDVQNAQNR